MTATVAIANAVVTFEGRRIPINAGTAWDAADPVVRAYPDMFSTDPKYLRRTGELVVEQATAAPGERRGTRRA